MAESILFGISSRIISDIASATVIKAYKKGASIWEARGELRKLKLTIQTIQAVLLDAEKKQEGSEAVKNWIQRLKGVMYDAEDLFDEVAADDLLKGLIMEGKNSHTCGCQPGTSLLFKGVLSLENQVRVCCSKLNPILSSNSIAKRVKAIRGRLVEISTDMDKLGFVQCHPSDPMVSMRREKDNARCFIGEKFVIGRDEDKNVILKMITSESSNSAGTDGHVVIAIEGIGGMGKTTLAHLIYNHKEVKKIFGNNRWFACISDTTDEIEVLRKIYQSVCGGSCIDLNAFKLQEKIEESIDGKKYLLILDDVWDGHRGTWENRKSMLSRGAKGSMVIVTTRLQLVVKAMGAVRTHNLKGLSEEASWDLLKSLAFDSHYENDPRREDVGRKMLQRCRGVPLAIWCMGSLLHNKTIQEWEEIERADLPIVGREYNDEIMRVLKLSYDHLPLQLKQCFTYCSLFPKDYRYNKMELIWHWIAQGYIKIDEKESSFMHLLRMGFFQEIEEDEFGEIKSCKMHDIMHDLAMHLGGEEFIVMSNTSVNVSSCTRFVSLMSGLWDIPMSLLDVKSIRSCILSVSSPNLGRLCSNFKLLRTLTLSDLRIEHIPSSIGELKLVRYLDLSMNKFEELPDSMANLVNLLVLNIYGCGKLKVWPRNFKKIKLWSLFLQGCGELRLMPEGIGEIASLQHLSDFKVGKMSEVEMLNGLLKQLRDFLLVTFCEEMEAEDELNWKIPADVSLQTLCISSYSGQRIRGWGNNNCTSRVEHLVMQDCKNVKYLPHLRCLPNLKSLKLEGLQNLEFVEEEEEVHALLFFPCLEKLVLDNLPKQKGWRGNVAAEATSSSFLEFSNLSKLHIKDCPNLNSFPRCPNLQEFKLDYDSLVIEQELSSTSLFSYSYPSLQRLDISRCCSLKKLHLASPHIQCIEIGKCDELMSIEVVGTPEPSLRNLDIYDCEQLKSLYIDEHLIAGLEEMRICNCPDLSLELSKTQGKRVPTSMGCKLELQEVDGVLAKKTLSSLLMSSLRSIKIEDCNGPMSLVGVAFTSLRDCEIELTQGMESLHIPSPHLQKVTLYNCKGLISVEFEAATHIEIGYCSELKNLRIANPNSLKEVKIVSPQYGMVESVDWDSIPNLNECSCISSISLDCVNREFIERLLPSPSSSSSSSSPFLTISHTSLEKFSIKDVDELKILNIELPLLRDLTINGCYELTNVRILHPTALTSLQIIYCELGLLTGIDWDALTNLIGLVIHPMPPREKLPQCLLQRQALGNLRIKDWW